MAQFRVGDAVRAAAPAAAPRSAPKPAAPAKAPSAAPARSTHMAAALKVIGRGGAAPASEPEADASAGWEEF